MKTLTSRSLTVVSGESPKNKRLMIHVTRTNVPFFDPSPKFVITSKAVHS